MRPRGAGKTSVAVEYAHRQLGETGVCWQFAAEDPAVHRLLVEVFQLARPLWDLTSDPLRSRVIARDEALAAE